MSARLQPRGCLGNVFSVCPRQFSSSEAALSTCLVSFPFYAFLPLPLPPIPYLLLYFYRGFGVGKRRGFQVIASTAQIASAVREPASTSGERCCARDKVCFLERASPFHNHVALTALSGSDGCVEREAFCLVEVSAILLSFAGELRVLVGELLSAC